MNVSFFRSVVEIFSGTRSHFNNVCINEWIKVRNTFSQVELPYSVIIENLLIKVLSTFEQDFCRGPFSNSIKCINNQLSRKIITIYLCYGVYIFSETNYCHNLSNIYSNFSILDLWGTIKSNLPDSMVIQRDINASKAAVGIPTAALYITLSELIKKETGKVWKASVDEILALPLSYKLSFQPILDNIKSNLT
jgi:hypothetical protein